MWGLVLRTLVLCGALVLRTLVLCGTPVLRTLVLCKVLILRTLALCGAHILIMVPFSVLTLDIRNFVHSFTQDFPLFLCELVICI